MKKVVEVNTGEVMAGDSGMILKSDAIGSCVVIAACAHKKKVGSLAHIMLPGRSPEKCPYQKTRYAADAIELMLKELTKLAVDIADIEVCLVGGANVLKRNDDTIWKDNIDSVMELLKEKNIKIRAKALGGEERRSVSFDIERGIVSYREGDGEEKVLTSKVIGNNIKPQIKEKLSWDMKV